MAPSGSGTTTPSGTNVPQIAGSTIPISATANTGYVFDHWSSSTGSITFGSSTTASTTASIGAAGTITANFVAIQATSLTVSCSPEKVDKPGSMQTTIQGFLTSGGSGVAGKQITLTFFDGSTWQTIGTATTQSDGSYSFIWNVPTTLPNGFYLVKADFAGDTYYYPSNAVTSNTPGGGGLLVAPEYVLGALASIGACFAALAVVKKGRKTKQQ